MKRSEMGRLVIFLLFFVFILAGYAEGKDRYRTFEIIGLSKDGLTLQDNDGNVIEVEKDSGDYKVGYKVRYDSIRNRLRGYRWQDYTVSAVTDKSITLQHLSGDILNLKGDHSKEYKVGDQVRYDSVEGKIQQDDESRQWQQYTVVASGQDRITLWSTRDGEITLYLDNNIYKAPRGLFIPKYKVGDKVRYNVATNKIKKGIIRTYDWKGYKVVDVTEEYLFLINKEKQELSLDNIYGDKYRVGDKVKYDRLNNLLKKVR